MSGGGRSNYALSTCCRHWSTAAVLTPGTVALIPSGVRHSGRAVTDCQLLDVFHPVREDYR